MKKKIIIGIVAAILIFFGIESFFAKDNKKIYNSAEKTETLETGSSDIAEKKLLVSGWIPYWKKTDGAAEFEKNIGRFGEIHPFAFSLNPDGSLNDQMRLSAAPWPELIDLARKNNIAVVPTIIGGNGQVMHDIFSSEKMRTDNINAIFQMLSAHDFPGVDIDYEGKDATDRALFSVFLEKLHQKLAGGNKTLGCTVEARTDDQIPAGWTAHQAMGYANDFNALNSFCDTVTIMAYDQVFQENGHKQKFMVSENTPDAPNADNRWVEEVIKYSLQSVSKDKIILGVPTYGWELEMEKTEGRYDYELFQSVSFERALAEAKAASVEPARDEGGELSFIYNNNNKQHIVTFSDSESVRQKIELAKKYDLKGVSLFKLDGLGDLEMFSGL